MTPIAITIVGASMRSQMLLEFLKKRKDVAFLAGIYDVVPQRGQYLLRQYGLQEEVPVHQSLEEAIDNPNSEALFVATPDGEHAESVIRGLQAGKHIYCEKPLDITLEACDAIIQAARQSEAVFYVGMNLRHSPVYETVHNTIASGEIGKVLTIEACEYYYGGRTYFRRWNRLRSRGGGLWITKACHDFDLLNWMAGGNPTSVSATSSLSWYKPKPQATLHCRNCPLKNECPDCYDIHNPGVHIPQIWDDLAAITEEVTGQKRDLCLYNSDKDTFDNGVAIVEYDNDVRATYVCNVVAPNQEIKRRMTVLGSDGALDADLAKGEVIVYDRHSPKNVRHDLAAAVRESSHGGADDRILLDFFRCCQSGDKPRSSWQDGRNSLLVGLAATEASDSHTLVDIKAEDLTPQVLEA